MKKTSWMNNSLLATMSDSQLLSIERIVNVKTFGVGELIIKENDIGDTFFLITSGNVSIYKEDERFTIAEMSVGDSFGLMTLIDGKPRSANVKAKNKVTVAEISLQQLAKLDPSAYTKLIENQLLAEQDWLRHTNDATVSSLKRELVAAKKQAAFANFFITFILMMCFYVFTMRIILDNIKNLNTTTFITAGILVGFVVLAMAYIKSSDYALSAFGFTLKNAKAHIKEALLWTILMMVVGTSLKLLYISLNPSANTTSILSFPIASKGVIFGSVITIVYAVFTIAQEFIARGLLQSSILQVLTGRYANARAVITSTLIFSITHLHLGSIYYSILVIIPSLVWGFLYARQRSLVGVVISHMIFGIWMTGIVGFPLLPA